LSEETSSPVSLRMNSPVSGSVTKTTESCHDIFLLSQ
jgi:hypothetical protein